MIIKKSNLKKNCNIQNNQRGFTMDFQKPRYLVTIFLLIILGAAASTYSEPKSTTTSIHTTTMSLKDFPQQNNQDIINEIRADSLMRAGEALAKKGDVTNALSNYNQALPLYRSGGNVRKTANCLLIIGDVYFEDNQFADAITKYKEAFNSIKDVDEPQIKAQCHHFTGWAYFKNGQYHNAVEAFDSALTIYHDLKKPKQKADCLYMKGLSLINIPKFKQSIAAFNKAVPKFKQLDNTLKQAKSLYYQGYSHFQLDEYEKSIPFFEQAIPLFKQIDEFELQADCFYYWASALYNLDRNNSAIEKFNQALELYQKVPNTTLEQAHCLKGLGRCYFQLKDYKNAVQNYEKAIVLFRPLKPKPKSQLATCLKMTGHSYYNSGKHGEALEPYKEAAKFYNELEDKENEAQSWYGAADCYRRLNLLKDAIEYYLNAVELYQGVKDQLKVANCNESLGDCYLDSTLYDSARDYYQRAADKYHLLKKQKSSEADCNWGVAQCYFKLGSYQDANKKYILAAAIYHQLKDVNDEALCCFNSGNCFFNLKDFDNALKKYQKANKLYTSLSDTSWQIQCSLQIGKTYQYVNSWEKAFEEYEKVIELCEKIEKPSLKAEAYLNMAKVHAKLEEKKGGKPGEYFEETRDYCILAINILINSNDPDDRENLAECYTFLAGLYFEIEKYDQAKENYKKAIEINKELELYENQALGYYNLGNIFFNQKNIDSAKVYYDSSLTIYQQINIPAGIARCQLMFGRCYLVLDPPQYDLAFAKFNTALKIFERLPEPDKKRIAQCYNGKGDVYAGKRQYSEAKSQYLEELECYTQIFAPKSKASCLLSLGDMLSELINWETAMKQYKDALDIFEKNNFYKETSSTNIKIANLYYKMVKYEFALKYYETALNMATRNNFKNHAIICNINIGNIYFDVDDPDSALWYYQKALPLARAEGDITNIGACLVNSGGIFLDREDIKNAQKYFDEALQIARRGSESTFLVTCLVNQGNLFCHRELLELGVKSYDEAQQISKRINHPEGQGLCLNNLGSIDIKNGRNSEAFEKFKQAERILTENYLRKLLITVYSNIGIVYENLGRYKQAAEAFKSAITIVEDIRTNLARERLLLCFIRSNADLYDHLIKLLLIKLDDAETAAVYLDRSKYVNLSEAYKRRAKASGDRRYVELLNQYEKEKQRISRLERKLRIERSAPIVERNNEDEERTINLLTTSQSKADSIAKELGPEVFMKERQLATLRNEISDSSIFLMYHPSQDSLFIFLVTSDTFYVHSVSISRNALNKKIKKYREFTANETGKSIKGRKRPVDYNWQSQTNQPLKDLSSELYQCLLGSIEKYILNKKRLTICPSGQLFYLPFHALYYRTSAGKLKFVVERWQVNYLTTAGAIRISQRSNSTISQRNILGLANPVGSNLPFSEFELDTLIKYEPQADTATGERATEDLFWLKKETVSDLYLSVHCMLNNKNPLISYLKLSPSVKNDGRLTTKEVMDSNLPNIKFVLVPNCNTALGEKNPGSEITSFADIFHLAGASSILATLWAVQDNHSHLLMCNFIRLYYNEKKFSKAEALRQAQIKLLSDPQYRHPAIWAAFTLIGDWK